MTRQVIASTDRRNDATLAADAASARSEEHRDSRRGSGGRSEHRGGGNRGGSSRGGERRDDSQGYRAESRDRPAAHAPRTEGYRSDVQRPQPAAAARTAWRPALDADRPAERPSRADRTRPSEHGHHNGDLGNVAFLARPSRDGAHKTGGHQARRPEARDQDRRPASGQRPARSNDRRDGRKAY